MARLFLFRLLPVSMMSLMPDPFEIVVEGDNLDFDAYIKG